MNRCLSERALLRISTEGGSAAEHSHLQLCADCAERYDALAEDLALIGGALQAPPPREISSPSAWRVTWIPAAASIAVIAAMVSLLWWREPSPARVATPLAAGSTFATDLSAALFATSRTNAPTQLASDAPYLEAALDEGQPCTRDRFLAGQCSDELSALLIEDE